VREALSQVEKDITQVEAAIVKKERWETRLVRRQDVDTLAGAFGDGPTRVREEVIPTSVLVGAEAERDHLERLLKKKSDLEGLTSGLGVDYREMRATEATDGGKGTDFRENKRFSTKMKALDFENEVVMADALRFLFRKAHSASMVFGETEETTSKRLPRMKIPFGYLRLARALKTNWENALAGGLESRSFGKAMMDRCQEWAGQLKTCPESREDELLALMKECEYSPAKYDAIPFSEVTEEAGADAELPLDANGGNGTADLPDEF
jgi:hypothetical protein